MAPRPTSEPVVNGGSIHIANAKGSPVKTSKTRASRQLNAVPAKGDDSKKNVDMDTQGQWVGPMPVSTFLKEFLPVPDSELQKMPTIPRRDHFDLGDYSLETEMYPRFIERMEQTGAMPGIKLVDTSAQVDADAPSTIKERPDIVGYNSNIDTSVSKMQNEHAEVIYELKPRSNISDPFVHPVSQTRAENHQVDSFEATQQTAWKCRAQIAIYALNWTSLQHRTHCFVVWIGDPWARIIRFDRTGAIVTERFSITCEGELLIEFSWRLAKATPAVRGRDITVKVANDEETWIAQKHLLDLKPWNTRTPKNVLKIEVPDEQSKMPHEVLVWYAFEVPDSVTGRTTRGYPAWDMTTQSLGFLKDSWRSVEPYTKKETSILRKLEKRNVVNTPRLVCGDDLPGEYHLTVTKKYASEPWNVGANVHDLVARAHIRFMTNIVGRPLNEFRSSREFLQAVSDAFDAHQEAFEKCQILHRDISSGNILITKNGRGFLNDWDLSKTLEDIEAGASQPHRSGTWHYMSIMLLRSCDKLHRREDDIESFFWVVLHYAIEYMLNSVPSQHVASVSRYLFEQQNFVMGKMEGGEMKRGYLLDRTANPQNFMVVANTPLTEFIQAFRGKLRSFYLASVIQEVDNPFPIQHNSVKELLGQLSASNGLQRILHYIFLDLESKEKQMKKRLPDAESQSGQTVKKIKAASTTTPTTAGVQQESVGLLSLQALQPPCQIMVSQMRPKQKSSTSSKVTSANDNI